MNQTRGRWATRAEGGGAYVLEEQAGHLLRRAHQRHTAIFQENIPDGQLTPLQFAALVKLHDLGEVSQNQLGRLIAMDAATGETLWEYTYASENQDFGQGAGPHATPLIAGDRLFTMGTNKEVHVFDPATGALLWSKNLVTDFGAPPLLIRSMVKPGYGVNPLAYKDTIIMQVGGPGQSVMALRQSDGEVVWKSGSFLVSHAPSGLILVDGRPHLVVFGGQAVFGMDPDTGQVLWAHAHDAGNDFNFQVPLYSDDDKILFFSSGYIGGSRAIRLVPDGDIVHTEELWYDPRLRFTFLNPLRIGDFICGHQPRADGPRSV